jgi:NAD(P)-dependent dehydrogenase (short-subunit alcohol dehydrogenase family)
MKLQGKVALITGAGSGVGAATAKLFAKEGAKVVVADIKTETGQEVVKQIKANGGEATFVHADVSVTADIENMIQTAVKSYGRLDILYNNAGHPGDKLEETTEEKLRKVIDINLTGPFLACMYAIPIMQKQGGGNILGTASIAAMKAGGRSPAYNASKGGLLMLTKALANKLAKYNIRVNCICPGSVDTNLTDAFMGYPKTEEERKKAQAVRLAKIPLGRAASAEEIASVALFLASDDASYITGVALPVDGGKTA